MNPFSRNVTGLAPRVNLDPEMIDKHAAWSNEQFSDEKERGPIGPLRHLAKEALEAAEAAEAGIDNIAKLTEEMADCTFLLLDAMRRSGVTGPDLNDAMRTKLPVLLARQYPKTAPDEPSEHIRDGEPEKGGRDEYPLLTLVNSQGEFVTHKRCLPFVELPRVVIWGDRVFTNTGKHDGVTRRPIYQEAFSVVLIDSLD